LCKDYAKSQITAKGKIKGLTNKKRAEFFRAKRIFSQSLTQKKDFSRRNFPDFA